ncbi:MAG: c-type cytochrome domain-containing protein, partial [Planctomycetaceae bacterium]
CHGARNRGGGTDLRSVALMTGSQAGHRPVVVSGKPDASRLYRLLQDGRMPPIGPLEPGDVQLIRSWIAAGCPATAPHAVYGATFFQNWGLLLSIFAFLNIVEVGILWRGTLNLATTLVVLAGLPVLALKASELYWFPPDRFACAAAMIMAAGLASGGFLIGRAHRKHPGLAVACTLLGHPGLMLLTPDRTQLDDNNTEATDADS